MKYQVYNKSAITLVQRYSFVRTHTVTFDKTGSGSPVQKLYSWTYALTLKYRLGENQEVLPATNAVIMILIMLVQRL